MESYFSELSSLPSFKLEANMRYLAWDWKRLKMQKRSYGYILFTLTQLVPGNCVRCCCSSQWLLLPSWWPVLVRSHRGACTSFRKDQMFLDFSFGSPTSILGACLASQQGFQLFLKATWVIEVGSLEMLRNWCKPSPSSPAPFYPHSPYFSPIFLPTSHTAVFCLQHQIQRWHP